VICRFQCPKSLLNIEFSSEVVMQEYAIRAFIENVVHLEASGHAICYESTTSIIGTRDGVRRVQTRENTHES
jgi:hypothetical protein